MNRTYLFGIALGIAVLGIALLGNRVPRVAGDCCGPAVCAAGLRHLCAGHLPSTALPPRLGPAVRSTCEPKCCCTPAACARPTAALRACLLLLRPPVSRRLAVRVIALPPGSDLLCEHLRAEVLLRRGPLLRPEGLRSGHLRRRPPAAPRPRAASAPASRRPAARSAASAFGPAVRALRAEVLLCSGCCADVLRADVLRTDAAARSVLPQERCCRERHCRKARKCCCESTCCCDQPPLAVAPTGGPPAATPHVTPRPPAPTPEKKT